MVTSNMSQDLFRRNSRKVLRPPKHHLLMSTMAEQCSVWHAGTHMNHHTAERESLGIESQSTSKVLLLISICRGSVPRILIVLQRPRIPSLCALTNNSIQSYVAATSYNHAANF